MKEWSKRVVSIICACVVVGLSVCSFSFTSNAEDKSIDVTERLFVMPTAEPSTGDNNGYCNILLKNKSNGNYIVRSYYWHTIVNSNANIDVDSFVNLYCYTDSDTIAFSFKNCTHYSIYDIRSNTGLTNQLVSQAVTVASLYTVDVSSLYDVIAWQVFGNVYSAYPSTSDVTFTVLFAPDSATYLTLKDILSELEVMESYDKSVASNVSSMKATIVNIYNELKTQTNLLDNYLTLILNELKSANTTLAGIKVDTLNLNATLSSCLSALIRIEELLRSSMPEESVPSVPQDDLDSYYAAEDELLLEDGFNSNLESVSPEIDGSSNSLIWYIIESFIAANPIIMSLIVVVCALGLAALILGR